MIQEYPVYDADAHAMLCPKMWEELPAAYAARRPRPVRIDDSADLGRWTNGWLIEGRLLPAPFGPGAQPGNEPKRVLREFGAPESGHFSTAITRWQVRQDATGNWVKAAVIGQIFFRPRCTPG